jgi:hypothetical protein
MHRGGQAPRPANDIKHGKMAVVGLAGVFGPYRTRPERLLQVSMISVPHVASASAVRHALPRRNESA